MATAAQIRASRKQNDAKTKQYSFRLHIDHDADIINQLDKVGSKAGYIKQLIREDIKKDGA